MKQRTLALVIISTIFTLYGPIAESSEAYAKSPQRFHFGKLKCARNVNAYRAKLGLRTTGSDSAESFKRVLRRVSKPRLGDVVVNSRPGGHHAQVYVGNGMCDNPRQNIGWRRVPCNSVWRNMPKSYWR